MLNNIDSRLNVSLKKQRLYEKQTKKAESILERQFGGSAYRCIIGSIEKKWSLSESLPIFQRKFRTQIQAERVIIQTMAQNIRKAREEQCLTQEDLAKKTGIARPNIVRLERGRHMPTLLTLLKVTRVLGLNIDTTAFTTYSISAE